MFRQMGISLLELMMSLSLASLIMTVLLQLYFTNLSQYGQMQKELVARFDQQWVGHLLSDSIRQAGFTPCLSIDQLSIFDHRTEKLVVVKGINSDSSPYQSIAVTRMSPLFSQISEPKNANQLLVDEAPTEVSLKKNQLVMIADCQYAEIQQVISVERMDHGSLITFVKPLHFSYSSPAYIGEWLEEKWLIKANNQGLTSLYYQLAHSEEVSPYVHSMNLVSQRINGKHLLKITLGFDGGKEQNIWVARRV